MLFLYFLQIYQAIPSSLRMKFKYYSSIHFGNENFVNHGKGAYYFDFYQAAKGFLCYLTILLVDVSTATDSV